MEPHCSGQWPVVWCSVFVITVCLCRDLGFSSVMSPTLSALLKKFRNKCLVIRLLLLIYNQLEKLEAAKAAGLVYLSLLSLD